MTKFLCYKLDGAIFNPQEKFKLNDFWVIPANKNLKSFKPEDTGLILVFQDKNESKLFLFCYQFLFDMSDVYFLSLLQEKENPFSELGKNIDEIAEKINKEYGRNKILEINFEEITFLHSGLHKKINFVSFYNEFIKKYKEIDEFKNIIDLYLYTICSRNRYYDNLYQKIASLQTIFETIVGRPKQKKLSCDFFHNEEEWSCFLNRKLKDNGFNNEKEIELFIKIKLKLSRNARVKYIHNSRQLDVNKKFLEEIRNSSISKEKRQDANSLDDLLKKNPNLWSSLDWGLAYEAYKRMIKQLIYFTYFKKSRENPKFK